MLASKPCRQGALLRGSRQRKPQTPSLDYNQDMKKLEPGERALRRFLATGLTVAAALRAVVAPAAGWPGWTADCRLHLARSADSGAYYLEIGFDSGVAPDLALQVRGRALRLHVRQDARAPGVACRTRISRTVTLPPDADPRHMERYEEGGRVTLVIPRRRASWR
jgi:hypothetical protein